MQIRGFPTLKLFDTDGGLYDYNGARSKDAMKAFCEGGYKKETRSAVPWNMTFIDRAKVFMGEYTTKIGQVMAYDPTLLPFFFLLGALFSGFFLCCCCNLCGG